jgi:hypothetical protein
LQKKYKRRPVNPPPWAAFPKEVSEWLPELECRLAKKHAKPGVRFSAVVDSGSPFCLFRADLGRQIGLDIHKGVPQDIGGVVSGGSEPAYFQKVSLYIENNWVIEVHAGFMENLSVGGLLGRRGFFENFIVRFDHSSLPPVLEIDRIPTIQ